METGKGKCNLFIYVAVLSVNLMSFVIGNSFSWSSPVIPIIIEDSPENPLPQPATTFELSCITSLLPLGAAIGPFLAQSPSEKIGRKNILLIFAIPTLMAQLSLAFASSVQLFYLARFVIGLGCGCALSVIPNYVSEVSENSNRGFMSFCLSLMLTLGTLSSYAIGPFVSLKIFGFINAVPTILFLIICGFFVPESPYYLISKNKIDLAAESLRKFRSKSNEEIKEELQEIIKSVEKSKLNQMKLREVFKLRAFRKAMLLCSGIIIIQQLTGVSAAQAYMETIFYKSKTSIPPKIAVNVVGTIQFLSTIFAAQLVDRLGRRILLLYSIAGVFISLNMLGIFFYMNSHDYNVDSIFWLPIVSLILYFFAYSIGLGPLAWTALGELFSANGKSIAGAIGTFLCFFGGFVVTTFFPILCDLISVWGMFFIFAFFTGIGFVFSKYFMLETKGKSLEEIQEMLMMKEILK